MVQKRGLRFDQVRKPTSQTRPSKDDPIAKALNHLNKVRKIFVTIENET